MNTGSAGMAACQSGYPPLWSWLKYLLWNFVQIFIILTWCSPDFSSSTTIRSKIEFVQYVYDQLAAKPMTFPDRYRPVGAPNQPNKSVIAGLISPPCSTTFAFFLHSDHCFLKFCSVTKCCFKVECFIKYQIITEDLANQLKQQAAVPTITPCQVLI